MKLLLTSIILLMFFCAASAQTYEQNQMDSLLRIINNPNVKDADRIDPLARLSRLYVGQDDSIEAAKLIDRARKLALEQKDSKYLIYVYNQKLMNILSTFPRDITTAYRMIADIYTAIAGTADPEAQAEGYAYIGNAKLWTDNKYDFEDHYKALAILEKMPDTSNKKHILLFNIYRDLYTSNQAENRENAEKYKNLTLQAARKTENKNFISQALTYQLIFSINYLSNDTNLISKNFDELESFISKNLNYMSSFNYGAAIVSLIAETTLFPDARKKQLADRHLANFKKNMKNSIQDKNMLIRIELPKAMGEDKFAEATTLALQQIQMDERWFQPAHLWNDYYNLATIYKQTKQWEHASGALDSCLKYYREYANIQIDEQRQLNEVKFGVAQQQQQIRQQKRRTTYTVIAAISVIVLLLIIVLLLNKQKKIDSLKKLAAELAAKQALAEKEKIGERLITNEVELTRKDKLLDKVKDMDSKQLDKAIRREQRTADVTKDYAKLFQEIRPEFYDRLARQAAPNKLSRTELMYCAYISLRMSSKDLANVMNVGYYTVATHKQNLKRKLHLARKDSLDDFIANFRPPIPITDYQ